MKFCVLALIALLVGCAGTTGGRAMGVNTWEEVGSAPKNYEKTSEAFIKSQLKDPDSLKQFSATAPIKTSCSVGIYGSHFGWLVRVTYNAKNSFGGYVGEKQIYLWFSGENIVRVTDDAGFCPAGQTFYAGV